MVLRLVASVLRLKNARYITNKILSFQIYCYIILSRMIKDSRGQYDYQ